MEWAALADGLAVGACAYAAATAASAEAHQALASLPAALETVDVGAIGASHLTEAQQMGFASWIEGHIGESVAADVLTQHGHSVMFAETANQPGWDLLVDGVPIQVKVGDHAASSIHEHFERYPDIPVVTDIHTADMLDNPLVQGLPGLEPAHIHELASKAMLSDYGTVDAQGSFHAGVAHADHADALSHDSAPDLSHGFDGVDGVDLTPHIPWITVGLGVFREAKLADRFGADFGESAGAIAADAAGVAIGAKGGALIGSALGPLGAIAGAIVGAVAGRSVVNAGRRANVEADLDRIRPKLKAVDDEWQRLARAFAGEAESRTERANRELRSRTAHVRRDYESLIGKLEREHDAATLQFVSRLHGAFDGFDAALEGDLRVLERLFPRRPRWQRILWPSPAERSRELGQKWVMAKRSELARWRERFERVVAEAELNRRSGVADARRLLTEFVATYKVWDPSANGALQETLGALDRIARSATEGHHAASKLILQELSQIESALRRELERLWESRLTELRQMVRSLDEEVRAVQRRATRAHMRAFSSPIEVLEDRARSVRAGIDRNTSGARRLAGLPAFA